MKKLRIVFASMFIYGLPAYAGGSGASGMATTVAASLATGMIMDQVAGTELMKKCKSGGGVGWACVAGAAALATAVSMADGSDDANSTKKGLSAGGKGFGEINNNGGLDPDLQKQVDLAKERAKAGLKDLAKMGYKANTKNGTVTDPKGKVHSMASLGSPQAMVDAGLASAEDIPEIDEALKAMQDKMKVVSIGVGGGGGGGSGSYKAASYSYEDPYKNLYGNNGEKPNAPKTSGLTRTLASGESIGAQSDNIFEMIRRSYQRKSDQKIFVGQQPNAE